MITESYGIINGFVCSNVNRAAILHLLKNSPDTAMQVERIATSIGISHRTVIYHLEVLKECGLVEVREYKTKGLVPMRSVWGLDLNNMGQINTVFEKINNVFSEEVLDKVITRNIRTR